MELHQTPQDCDGSLKFNCLIEKLLALTQSRICDRKLLSTYFKEVNELDPRLFNINDRNAMMLLVNQLCSVIQPSEDSLIIGCSRFLANLIQRITLQGRTFTVCMRWVTENLEFSEPIAASDLLCALQNLLLTGPSDSLGQDLRKLLGEKSVLSKHIHPDNQNWNEEQFIAISCLRAILLHAEKNEYPIQLELLMYIKSATLQILSKLPLEGVDRMYYNKMVSLCLQILRTLLTERFRLQIDGNVGQLLGVIQVHLFHGIEGYPNVTPLILLPSSMNLPDIAHSTQKKKYFRNHKAKNKRQPSKKAAPNNISLDSTGIYKYSSDSDTSDSESKNMKQSESRVRLEAIYLLNALVECTPSREIFGFWTQIVASGSRSDARVLTRCILKEPNAKVRQTALTTLNDLLIRAKVFLSHAEDVEKMSFVTVFGMLSSVIKEIHFALSLLLGTERNVVVLTQALKCAAALAQGTPYSRLKPGLATKLIRNCRNHLLHKDPTVRVAALAVFETLALSDPLTPEIHSILAKSSNVDLNDIEIPNFDSNSCDDTEIEEIVCDDLNENVDDQINLTHTADDQEARVSALVKICFRNVTREISNEPVRLQSLKLLGTLAFNASSLIFSHIEAITDSLISIANHEPSEPQVSFHACRVLEIIAGRLSDSGSENVSQFWNIAFKPIIALVQHSQTNMREIACDCLGNIGAEMFAQLSREKSIMVITVLFGAAKDEESAVRAASLRALGLLVSLPTLEEDTGFLLDLTDTACFASEDRNLGVRVKAAWALASLCDCLVKREDNVEVEAIPLETVLPKLYSTSTRAAQDNEKVKCNAVRAIGNIMYLCPDQSILQDTTSGLEALINCATTGNDMKVRWNACRAIGTVLSRDPDIKLIPTWKEKVFPVLCDLVCNSPNFKVRTNAAWALSVCNSFNKHIILLWKSIFLALENSQHVPSYVEYAHRDALVQQLCLALCHLAIHTEVSELESLWIEIKDHFEEICHHMKQFQDHVLPEKAGDLSKAQACFLSFTQNAPKSGVEQCAKKLLELFKKEDRFSNIDAFPIEK